MGVVENIEEIDKENEWLCKMIYLYIHQILFEIQFLICNDMR